MEIRSLKKTDLRPRGPVIVLVVFFVFTAVALIGYGTFGRHPELLRGSPALAAFYGTAFQFFAQAHVVLGAFVLIYYLIREAGASWLWSLVLVYGVSLLSEVVGTSTGLPFGSYSYSGLLGWKWFGLVPLLIPLSWFLMAVPAYVMARRRFPESGASVQRVLLGAALLTAWDLALDPAMSGATNYWTWGDVGPYYGMPLVNLVGWMLTGVVLMMLIQAASNAKWLDRLSVRWNAAYYGLTVLMPLGMLLAAEMWTGAAIGLAVPAALVAFALMRRTRRSAPGMTHSASVPEATVRRPDPKYAAAYVRYRAAAVGDTSAPLDFFSHHSRSFSFAARSFGADEQRLIAGLYAFCRTTDDLVDRRVDEPGQASEEDNRSLFMRLDVWRDLSRRAYDHGDTGIPWLDGIMMESAARHVPFTLACELIDGVEMDVQKVRIKTWDELDLYMYRVASVVGVWMCYLFGVTDAASHRRAAALGKAMQLTNILRDVGEDLADDRIYLPEDVLRRYDLDDESLRKIGASLRDGAEVPAAYRALMHELIGRADALYEVARPGFAALPPTFARATAIAAAVYREIHREIRFNAYDNFEKRAVTSTQRKIVLAGRALLLHRTSQPRLIRTGPLQALRKAVAHAATTLLPSIIAIVLSVGAPTGAFAAASPGHGSLDCPELAEIRSGYIRSVSDQAQIGRTRDAIEGCSLPVVRAYDGALITLRAKHAFWPPSRLRYVREGLAILDEQVRLHSTGVEIRYLRLLSCYFLPSFLGRGWSVDEDFDNLAAALPNASDDYPADLFEEMVRFVVHRGEPSSSQRETLLAALEYANDRTDP